MATDPPSDLGRRVGSAVRWSAVNSLLQRVAQVGVGILLARIIAPEQFGVFAVALVVLNIILSVSELGVSVAVVRHPGDVGEVAPTVTTLSIASGVLLAGVVVAVAPLVATVMNAPEATGVVQLMAVALVVAGISAVPAAILQRNFRQDHKLVADGTGFVVGTAVAIGLALFGFGAWSLAWQRIATNVAAAVVLFALTTPRYRPGFDAARAREVLTFGLPLAGSSFLVFAVLNVDYVLVGALLGPVPLALYLLAFNLASWPVGAFSQPVRSVSIAAFSRLQDDPPRLAASFGRALGLLALFTVPATVLLATLGQPLVRFVYGDAWADAAAPLALLVLVGALRVAMELSYDFLAGLGRSRAILVIHIVWLAVLLPAVAVGARLDGIRGVAAAQLIVAVAVVGPAYLLALRSFGITPGPLGRELARPVVGGLLAVAVVLAVRVAVPGEVPQLLLGGTLAAAFFLAAVLTQVGEAWAILRRSAR